MSEYKLVYTGKIYELYIMPSEEGLYNLNGDRFVYRMINTRTGVAEAEHTLLPAALRLLTMAEENYVDPEVAQALATASPDRVLN